MNTREERLEGGSPSLRVILPVLFLWLIIALPLASVGTCLTDAFAFPEESTRRTAVADFIAALQMEDGSFVDKLTAPKSLACTSITRRGVEALSVVTSLACINQQTAASYVGACQGSSGAIYASPKDVPNGPHDMWCVDDAVTTLSALNCLDVINTGQLTYWTLACQRTDGGFNDEPSQTDTAIWNTYCAVRALVGLGGSFDKSRVVQNVLTYHSGDGGFAVWAGDPSDFQATFYGVATLALCGGLGSIDVNLTASYLLGNYRATEGSFGGYVFYTYSGCMSLKLLGRLGLVNATRVGAYILSCQRHTHGGFATSPGVEFEEIDSSWSAILCLSALGLLPLLNEEFEVLEKPVWTGDGDTTTTTTTTSTTPPISITPAELVVLGIMVGAIVFFVALALVHESPHKTRKIIRKRRR
jgi:prenyltransferase beta subunit